MSSNKPNQDLNMSVMQYLSMCLDLGLYDEISTVGLTREDIQAFKQLKMEDMQEMTKVTGSFLMISIDRDVFCRACKRVSEKRDEEDVLDQLLLSGAALPMMTHLYGISGTEYADRRRLLDLSAGIGRTPIATEDEELIIWKEFKKIDSPDFELISPPQWLSLSKICNVPLRTIWVMFQELEKDATNAA